jgi:hypothetical protein
MNGWRIYVDGVRVASGLDCYTAHRIVVALRRDGRAPVLVSPGGVPWR